MCVVEKLGLASSMANFTFRRWQPVHIHQSVLRKCAFEHISCLVYRTDDTIARAVLLLLARCEFEQRKVKCRHTCKPAFLSSKVNKHAFCLEAIVANTTIIAMTKRAFVSIGI